MNNSSSTDSRRILVLGGDGFVGTNVVGVLREEGLDPTILSRKTGIDLRQRAAVGDFLSDHKPDFIVNCAAHVGSLNYVTQQAADVIYDNSLMLLNLYQSVVDACPNAVIINPIANCAYPATSTTFREDEWWNGHLHRSVLSYGATRRHMWAISECYEMQHNVRTVSLLVPNMYGPHDSEDPNKAHALNALACKFLRASKDGSAVTVWGTGIAVREWLYAADFGRIIAEIIRSDARMIGLEEPLNIAQNFGLSVRELVGILTQHFGGSIDVQWDKDRPDGAPRKVMDDSRFRRVFPDFQFKTLESGLIDTIAYYESLNA